MLKSMYGGLYMKVKIGISNRHIHLSQTDANILFKENYQFKKRNDLLFLLIKKKNYRSF